MRILITGTREELTIDDIGKILATVQENVDRTVGVTIVHGDCPTGVDAFFNKMGNVVIERHPADWAAHGKFAGPKRNQEMVDLGADICLAFPKGESRGTRGCVKMAKVAGIPTIITEL